jgi:hypothetical protein
VSRLTLLKSSVVWLLGFCGQSSFVSFLLLANSEHSSSNQGLFLFVSKILTLSFAEVLILSLILTQVSSTPDIYKPPKAENLLATSIRYSFLVSWSTSYLNSTYLLPNVALFPYLMTDYLLWSQPLGNDRYHNRLILMNEHQLFLIYVNINSIKSIVFSSEIFLWISQFLNIYSIKEIWDE